MFLLRIALYQTPFPSQLSLASQNPDMEQCFLKNLCDCELEGPGRGGKKAKSNNPDEDAKDVTEGESSFYGVLCS